MAEFHRFSELPEPLPVAIFVAAWRDAAAWSNPLARERLRLVCRQARTSIDAAVEKLSVWAQDYGDQNPFDHLNACITAVGAGQFPALREWHLLVSWHGRVEDGTIAALAQAIPATLQKLDINGIPISAPDAVALAGAAAMPALRELILNWTGMGGAAFHVLAQSFGPHLEVLDIYENSFGSDGAAALAGVAAARLPALRELSFPDRHLGAAGVRALMQVAWPALEVLNLESSNLKLEGAAELAAAGMARLPMLRKLLLCNNDIGNGGVEALVQVAWGALEVLDLQENCIARAGAVALADASMARLPVLRELYLSHNYICQAGAMRALGRAAWGALEVLDLGSGEGIDNDNIAELMAAGAAHLQKLRRLDLSYSVARYEGVRTLAQRPWPCLQQLDLTSTCIGVRGVAALGAAGARCFPQLTCLSLSGNKLGGAGIQALLQPAAWACLQSLDLSLTGLHAEGLAALATASSAGHLPALRELTLGGDDLCSVSVEALAEGDWRHLQVLEYTIPEYEYKSPRNRERGIPLGGAAALAAAGVARFPALRRLGFFEFPMSEEHLAALEAAWPHGISILRIWPDFLYESHDRGSLVHAQRTGRPLLDAYRYIV